MVDLNWGQLCIFWVLEGTKSPIQKISLIKITVIDSCRFFVICGNVRVCAANSGASGLFVLEKSGHHRHTLCVHRRGTRERKASKGESNANCALEAKPQPLTVHLLERGLQKRFLPHLYSHAGCYALLWELILHSTGSLTRTDGSRCLLSSPCVRNTRYWLGGCLTKQKLLIELMHLRVVIDHAVSLPNAWQQDRGERKRHTKKNKS